MIDQHCVIKPYSILFIEIVTIPVAKKYVKATCDFLRKII